MNRRLCGSEERLRTHFLIIDINSMHCIAILHALHNLSFSFTITFTFNNNETIVEIHCDVDNIFDV